MDIESLVKRVYSKLYQNNHTSSEKLPIKNLNVVIENKKTYFYSFRSICQLISREENNLKKFFEEELSKKTSITMNGCLIIDGIFNIASIQKILKSYLKTFVICQECKSFKTALEKSNKIQYVNCSKCLSRIAI